MSSDEECGHLLSPGRPSVQIREDEEDAYREYSLSPMLKFIVVFVLTLSLAGMGSFVFLESVSFPCDQYLLAQLYTVCYALLYTVTHVALHGRESIRYVKERIHVQHVAIIGLFWATNYEYILISASHISNSMQILVIQLQLIIVVLIDYFFVGIQLSSYKVVCICVNISGNMLAIGAIGLTVGLGDLFWTFIFFVSSVAMGMANIYSEIYIKILATPYSPFMDKIKATVAINMLSNLIGIFVTFLAIPVGKYSIGVHAPLYNFSVFSEPEIWYWVGMIFTSYLYSICSYLLLHSESSIYATMCTGIGLFLQLCFFMTPATNYQTIPHGAVIAASVIVVISSVAYVAKPELRNDNLMRKSSFEPGPAYEYCNIVLSIMYIIFIAIYFIIDTLIPLLPPLHDCHEDFHSHGLG